MDRDRSIKRAWDVFGAPPPASSSRHQAAAASSARHRQPPPPKGVSAEKNANSDSAISGSSDEEEREICRIFDYLNQEEQSRSGRSKSKRKEADKTAGGEIQHIERHLSMKKTLRKKMMRDLRQAFVDDPNEFRQDPQSIPDEQRNLINIQNLRLAPDRTAQPQTGENFLGMLKDEPDSGRGSPTREHDRPATKPKEKLSFWKRLTGGGKKSKR